jgi:hypothetical protein
VKEHRRTASLVVSLVIGLALLGLALYVVPRTAAAPNSGPFVGTGSSAVVQVSPNPAVVEADRARPDDQKQKPHVVAEAVKGSRPPGPKRRSPYYDSSTGGGGGDWTHLPAFPHLGRTFDVQVGDVAGLYPGVATSLPVTFVNPMRAPLSVQRATVSAVGTVQCGAENLDLATVVFDEPVRVPARSAVAGALPLSMLSTAGDGCQGATFTVTVDATAVAG